MKPYKLLKIYKEAGIKKKKIRQAKILSEVSLRKIRFQIPEARDKLNHYISRGFRIIYLDECMVTKTTLPTHAWSNLKSNIDICYN